MTYNQLRILKALEVAAGALEEVATYCGTTTTATTAVAARERGRLLKRMEVLRAEFDGATGDA